MLRECDHIPFSPQNFSWQVSTASLIAGSRFMAASAQNAVEVTAAKLLDFSQPLDVSLLDATVNAFYGAGSNDEVLPVPPFSSTPSTLHSPSVPTTNGGPPAAPLICLGLMLAACGSGVRVEESARPPRRLDQGGRHLGTIQKPTNQVFRAAGSVSPCWIVNSVCVIQNPVIQQKCAAFNFPLCQSRTAAGLPGACSSRATFAFLCPTGVRGSD